MTRKRRKRIFDSLEVAHSWAESPIPLVYISIMNPQKHIFNKFKAKGDKRGAVVWCEQCNKVVKTPSCLKCDSPSCGVTIHNKCLSSAQSTSCPHPSVAPTGFFRRAISDCMGDCEIFVSTCFKFIEADLTMQGLYRVCGLQTEVLALQTAANKSPSNFIGPTTDVHAVTGLLKLWIRELPDPLVPYSLYPLFIAAAVGKEIDRDVLADIIAELPAQNAKLFQSLLLHLRKIILYHDVNMMTSMNLAIVFAPSVLRPEIETPDVILSDARFATDLIDELINNADQYFDLAPPPPPSSAPPPSAPMKSPARPSAPPSIDPNPFPPTLSQSPKAVSVLSPAPAGATVRLSGDVWEAIEAASYPATAPSSAPESVPPKSSEKKEKNGKENEPQWPPASSEHSRFKVLFPEIYNKPHLPPPTNPPVPADGAKQPRRARPGQNPATLRLKEQYATHRKNTEQAFNTLKTHLESAKKNSLGQFVAAIKEGAVDEQQFPQLTSWLDSYSQ